MSYIKQKFVTIKTASDTLSIMEMGDIIVNSVNATIMTLPSGSKGLWYHVHNFGSGVVSISDGSVMTTLAQYESAIILYNTDTSTWGYTKGGGSGSSTSDITLYVGYQSVKTGLASTTLGSVNVTGAGTFFTSEFVTGDYISIGSLVQDKIDSIIDDTHLVLANEALYEMIGQSVYKIMKGDDNNDGTAADSTHALATVQEAINRIPLEVNHTAIISVLSNDYYTVEDEQLDLSNKIGIGSIQIDCSSNHALLHSIDISNCKIEVIFTGFMLKHITVNNSSPVFLSYLTIDSDDVGNTYGVDVNIFSYVDILNSTISGHYEAVDAYWGSIISSQNNSGSNNNYGLSSYRGSIIAVNGTQPTGTVENEHAEGGGIITKEVIGSVLEADTIDGKHVDDTQISDGYLWTAAKIISYTNVHDRLHDMNSVLDHNAATAANYNKYLHANEINGEIEWLEISYSPNVDGGHPDSIYGGMTSIDGGGVV